MIALVFGVIAASSFAGSRLKVTGSMSTNVGWAPTREMAPTVAKNV